MDKNNKNVRPDAVSGRPDSGKTVPVDALADVISHTVRDVLARVLSEENGVFAQYTAKINELIRLINLVKDELRDLQVTVYGMVDEDAGTVAPGLVNQVNQVNDLATVAIRMANSANPLIVTFEEVFAALKKLSEIRALDADAFKHVVTGGSLDAIPGAVKYAPSEENDPPTSSVH